MKKFKILFITFIASCIFCAIGANADSHKAWVTLDLGAFKEIYTSGSYSKTVLSNQYAKKDYATDKLSGDERAVEARLQNITTGWTTLPKGQITQLNMGSTNLGQSTGTYKLQLRLQKSTISGARFGGIWYLDDTLI